MITLYSNLSYDLSENEKFSIEKIANPINFPQREMSSLSPEQKIVYEAFIAFVGYANAIIADVPGEDEGYLFYRHKDFYHDDRYNIIGHDNYLKSYNDLNFSEKKIVDDFVALLSSFS